MCTDVCGIMCVRGVTLHTIYGTHIIQDSIPCIERKLDGEWRAIPGELWKKRKYRENGKSEKEHLCRLLQTSAQVRGGQSLTKDCPWRHVRSGKAGRVMWGMECAVWYVCHVSVPSQ